MLVQRTDAGTEAGAQTQSLKVYENAVYIIKKTNPQLVENLKIF